MKIQIHIQRPLSDLSGVINSPAAKFSVARWEEIFGIRVGEHRWKDGVSAGCTWHKTLVENPCWSRYFMIFMRSAMNQLEKNVLEQSVGKIEMIFSFQWLWKYDCWSLDLPKKMFANLGWQLLSAAPRPGGTFGRMGGRLRVPRMPMAAFANQPTQPTQRNASRSLLREVFFWCK